MRRHPWWSTGIGITLLSAVIVFVARTRPGFDPYGWLVWGHQTLSLSLDTNAAPSWKPLPYLFTVPYALAGHYQLRLWMITRSPSPWAGRVFAGRIAYRLVDPPPERRWAAIVAGVFAGLAVLGIQNYSHYILSSQSDPMIVSLCLGAIDCHLYKRPRAAFLLLLLAVAGPARGVAVPGHVLALDVAAAAGHPLAGGRRLGCAGAAVVRDPGDHLADPVRVGQQRARLRPQADQRSGRRHDPALPGPQRAAGRACRAGRACVRARAARPCPAGPDRRDRAVGRDRDRVRAARLARAGALHVRGRRGVGGARRGGGRSAA